MQTRTLSAIFFSLFCFGLFTPLSAQNGRTRAVRVYAETQADPAQITLRWESSPHPVQLYYIHRRVVSSDTWVYQGNDPSPEATQWVDNNVTLGTRYEYRVYRQYDPDISTAHARGYTLAGIDAPLMDQRGTVILLVDETQASALAEEIDRFVLDLTGDGWNVVTESAHPSDSPPSVRAKLQTIYNADPSNVKAAILLGRIPVPYSGDIFPDGHTPDHRGAWPADTYYADLTGTWTDDTVNNTGASQARNRNIPGDGKFDQSNLPSDANIAVGRIDMANLSGFSAGANETELLRNYLRKNHEFRHRLGDFADVPRRGVIRDGFGFLSGEAPASAAWRGFTAMFGPAHVDTASNLLNTIETNPYLWAYGAGAGSYTSGSGIGTSTDFKTRDSLAVFMMLFGSYFGDWDSPTDNFLRAPLAGTPGGLTLATTWGNRPDWHVHGMALGETIGDAYFRTVNNPSDWNPNWTKGYFTYYTSHPRMVHIALMGDPTLRLHPVAAPTNGAYVRAGGSVELNWQAPSNEPDLLGYHVYRADSLHGPYTRLTASPLVSTQYTDSASPAGSVYQVRAVTLTESASGSYHNAGQALFLEEGPGEISFTSAVFEAMEPVYDGTPSTLTKTVTVTVERSGGSQGEVSVPYTVTALESLSFAHQNEGAIDREFRTSSGRPFVHEGSGFLTWVDGESGEKSFTFEIHSDKIWENFEATANPLVEGIESLFMFLGQPRGGATLGEHPRARFDILDAEAPAGGQGVIQFERPRYSAFEDAGTMPIILRRVQGSTGTVGATFNASSNLQPGYDGFANPITPATAGVHYTAFTQTVTWEDGDTEDKVVHIPLFDNDDVHSATNSRGVRGIRLHLTNPTGGAEVSVNEAMGLILDTNSEVFDVWIDNQYGKRISIRLPRNTETIRGLIYFLPGTGGDWRYKVDLPSNQAVADQWGFAIAGQLANAFATNRPSGIAQFHNHLDTLALFTGRPELRNVPIIFTGISAGGYACTNSHGGIPGQVLGFVAHKGGAYSFNRGVSQYDTHPFIHESNLFTPGILISGGNDGTVTAKDLYDDFLLYRNNLPPGSQFTTAVDWNIGHTANGGQGWAMTYLFMDELIRTRYPAGQLPGTEFGEIVNLINVPHEDTWLVEQVDDFLGNGRPDPALASTNLEIRPAAGVEDPGNDGIVLTERIARAYQAFSSLHSASYQSAVPFQSPLRISSHTTTHEQITAIDLGQSTTVALDPRGYSNFNRADFYFNNELAGTLTSAPWSLTFTPEESGVALLRVETSTDGGGEIRYAFETLLVRDIPPVPPVAPTGLSVSRPTDTTASLTWDTSPFTSTILVQRSATGAEGTWETIATLDGLATSYADSGLAAGASYWYRLIASNTFGDSPATAAAVILVESYELIVHDPFTDGGTTQGADPLDVNWGITGNTFTVVQDSVLDPVAPHNVAELSIATSNKDEYISFALPSAVNLDIDEGLRVSFNLRHTGTPRDNASTTGVSLAHVPGTAPWNNANNREYFFTTSYGNAGNLGSIRKTGAGGAQILNVGTQTLASNTASVNVGTDVTTVALEVYRLGPSAMRIRYQLDGGPVQEVIDTADLATAFNRVFIRFRTRTDAPEPAFRIDEVKVEKITPTLESDLPPTVENELSLSFAPETVNETDGTLEATISRTVASGDQIVFFSSDDPRLVPPGFVTIPDGELSQVFHITVLDDTGLTESGLATISAHAPLAIAGESFTGPAGSDVAGQNTGWGWSGSWIGVNASPVLVEPSLTYTQNGTIGTPGTRAARLVNAGAGGQAYRQFAQKHSTGSVWVSALIYRDSSNWGTQIIVRDNPGSGAWARIRYENNTNHWMLEGSSEVTSAQLLDSNPRPTTFFVVMEFDFANEKVRAWLNPNVSGASPANALASAEIDMPGNLGGINRLDIAGHSNDDQFDAIRVANSFAGLYQSLTASAEIEVIVESTESVAVSFESDAELAGAFRANHGSADRLASAGLSGSGALATTGNPQLLYRAETFSAAQANALGVYVHIGEQANSGYDSVTAMLGFVTKPTMNFQGGASDPNVFVAGRVLNLSNNGGYRLEILNKTAPGVAQSVVANGSTFALSNGGWYYVRHLMIPDGDNTFSVTLEVHASDAAGNVGELVSSLTGEVINAEVAADTRLWAFLRSRRDGNAAAMDDFAVSTATPAPAPILTFVMAGQSNAVGYRSNNRNALPEAIRNGVPGVLGAWLVGNKNNNALVPFTSNGWGTLDLQNVGTSNGPFWPNSEGFGPEITLARQLQLHYETDIAVMKFAVNGASLFENFDPGNTGTSGYYDEMRDYLLARRAELEIQEDREASIEAFFWLQGESDASSNSPQPASADGYQANLEDFVQTVRADLGVPELWFIASQINPRSEAFTEENLAKVNNALAAVSVDDPRFRLSPAIDLHPASGDELHFDSPQTMEIGERLATAYLVGHADSTGSGADDAWELATFGNLDGTPVEIQGQLYSRRTVFVWGLDEPQNQVFSMEGLSFPTVSSRVYQIQYRENLLEGTWVDFGQPLDGTGQPVEIENPPDGFYRIQVNLPEP